MQFLFSLESLEKCNSMDMEIEMSSISLLLKVVQLLNKKSVQN